MSKQQLYTEEFKIEASFMAPIQLCALYHSM